MDLPIGIHTICYAPGMTAKIDPAFLPFDVSANPEADRREIAHMLSFCRAGHHRNYSVSGLLSPKFSEKTGLGGSAFINFIRANPDYDVWFINPFPHLRYLSFNIWEQGEFWHPGLCQRAAKLFQKAGTDIDVFSFPRSNSETLLFCNFWAGTPKFWDRFLTSIEMLIKVSETLPEVFQKTSHDTRTTYFPFLFERYFTTFLSLNSDIRACPWRYSFEETARHCASEMEYLCINEWAPMIDRWDTENTYNADQRRTFQNIQKVCALFFRMKMQAIAALSKQAQNPAAR